VTATPEPTAASRRRVVIAEDEALIRLDLAEMLGEEGYDVVGQAEDGQKAVELVLEHRPDLVILDVKMPRLDGIAAAEQIAAQRIAPVVILTAFSQRDLVERARDAGAMAYLVKPFQKADLVPAIEIAVSRHEQMAALEDEIADLTLSQTGLPGPRYRGVGESIEAVVPAAIGNAVFDATGVRMRQIPLTPAKVRDALRQAGRLYKA